MERPSERGAPQVQTEPTAVLLRGSLGASRAEARSASACSAHFGAGPCPYTRGAVSPVSRRRGFMRRTQLGLTRYFAVTSAVGGPASQSASTRSRKSAE
ncbi:MAG: hypothetical protein P4L85_10300 [Paludisphaera borealis]|uniref:hypothetical protein n=1 Tax=Paludisphaera borealis TaxID=1387353 RepID=UPI00283DC0CA|nr:hypothetical protein [Paludisphaera borealis]MDR3619729.1 hypothetical protein [Paludisphaera borealis]